MDAGGARPIISRVKKSSRGAPAAGQTAGTNWVGGARKAKGPAPRRTRTESRGEKGQGAQKSCVARLRGSRSESPNSSQKSERKLSFPKASNSLKRNERSQHADEICPANAHRLNYGSLWSQLWIVVVSIVGRHRPSSRCSGSLCRHRLWAFPVVASEKLGDQRALRPAPGGELGAAARSSVFDAPASVVEDLRPPELGFLRRRQSSAPQLEPSRTANFFAHECHFHFPAHSRADLGTKYAVYASSPISSGNR